MLRGVSSLVGLIYPNTEKHQNIPCHLNLYPMVLNTISCRIKRRNDLLISCAVDSFAIFRQLVSQLIIRDTSLTAHFGGFSIV